MLTADQRAELRVFAQTGDLFTLDARRLVMLLLDEHPADLLNAYRREAAQDAKTITALKQRVAELESEAKVLREYYEAGCFEHADGCCAEWCSGCQSFKRTSAAVEAFDAARAGKAGGNGEH